MNMSLESFIILLVVGAIVGIVGQQLAGYSRGGLLVAIVIGFIGALIGTWAIKQFGFPEFFVLRIANTSIPIVWSVIGAAVFVALFGLISRRNYA
jgi:uncharacterized membrane protein YeaQ/YmgE (transglycosylase-associated protein family)